MPTPKKGEKLQAFLDRCIPMVIREGKKSGQAYPICQNLFMIRKKNNGKKKK